LNGNIEEKMQVEIEKLQSEVKPLQPVAPKSDQSQTPDTVILINETERDEGVKTAKKSLITLTNKSNKNKSKKVQ